MTKEEKDVLIKLGAAWDAFANLPKYHPADLDEFCRAIHVCQNIVLSRCGLREMRMADAIEAKKLRPDDNSR